jgi:uncharacterized protein (DUF2336 family)
VSIPLDAKALLALASNRSRERRNELALAMIDLFHDGDAILTERERLMMVDILHRLIREMENTLRRAVADRLSTEELAPHSIVQELANDQIEVAWPILLKSRVLEDVDLIEIIYHRSLEHKLAIAQRGALSESVADALIRSGEERLIVTLLNNQDARISQAAMEHLVEQSKRIDSFQEPLVLRQELTDELARRMFGWVSAALRRHLVERFNIAPNTADNLLETVTENVATPSPSPGKDAVLVGEVVRAGFMEPALAVQALAAGDVALFGRIIENLTGIRPRLAKKLLFEAGGESLAALCHAIGLTKAEFLSIYKIGRKARPSNRDQVEEDCQRLAEFFSQLSKEASQSTVAHWRRNPNYLAAVRTIELAGGHLG